MRIRLITLCLAATCSGCTALNIWEHRPSSTVYLSSDVKGGGNEVVAALSLDATRRTVLVSLVEPNKGRFCAEPPPDVALSVAEAQSLSAAGNVKTPTQVEVAASAQAASSYSAIAVDLAHRTALVDIYRTGTYALCQFWINGAITGRELADQFELLTKGLMDSLKYGSKDTTAPPKAVEPSNADKKPT